MSDLGIEDQLLDEIISYLDEDDIDNMHRFSNGVEIRMGSEQVYVIYIQDDSVHTKCQAKGIEFILSSFKIADPECFDKIKRTLKGETE
jgi:hypothetical protein